MADWWYKTAIEIAKVYKISLFKEYLYSGYSDGTNYPDVLHLVQQQQWIVVPSCFYKNQAS